MVRILLNPSLHFTMGVRNFTSRNFNQLRRAFIGNNLVHFSVGTLIVSVTITLRAEVNLAWWLAWTSNPVVVRREAG